MATQLQRSRALAFRRQDGRCYYCELPMWLDGPPGPALLRCTAEHLLAKCEGGGDHPANIVATCAHCNWTRHKRKPPPEPDRYREQVRKRVARGAWLPSTVLAAVRRPPASPRR